MLLEMLEKIWLCEKWAQANSKCYKEMYLQIKFLI